MSRGTGAIRRDRINEQIVRKVLDGLGVERPQSGGPDHIVASAPYREDRRPSFSINVTNGRWNDKAPAHDHLKGDLFELVKLTKGCGFPEAITWIEDLTGVQLRDDPTRSPNGRHQVIAEYVYTDATGTPRYKVLRYDPKDFRVMRTDETGEWTWGYKKDAPRYLYRLPEVAEAAERWVLFVEGEKDADAAHQAGFVATTIAGGVNAWRDEYVDQLRDRNVAIIPDNDEPGQEFARRVASSIAGIAKRVRVVELSQLGPRTKSHGRDFSDWLNDGYGPADLKPLIADAPDYDPVADVSGETQSEVQPAPFPVHAIPEPMRSLIAEGAAAIDAPPEFIALPLLAITGGLIGPKVSLKLKETWTVTAQLWLAMVAAPGGAKTPSLQIARRPLDTLQNESYERYKAEVAKFKQDIAEWGVQQDGQRGPKPDTPRLDSKYTSDVTTEGLSAMLAHNAGLTVIRDELVSWVKSNDAYRGGKGGDRQNWLSMWSGEPIKIDRKSQEPIYVQHPVVSVVGGVQPDMLPMLAEEAGRQDGFIDRFLWSYPAPRFPAWTECDVDPHTVKAVEQVLRQINSLEEKVDQPIRLGRDARSLWINWHHENREALSKATGVLQGTCAKLPVQLARLALILHVLTPSGDGIHRIHPSIGGETMEAAIEIVEYFRAHAHRVLPRFGAATLPVPGLTPERQAILKYHQQHGAASSQDVADALELPMKSVNNMHRKLTEMAILHQPKRGLYDIAPSPDSTTQSSDSTNTAPWMDRNDGFEDV